MNKIALYPGTFDPITNGHLDIIERSLSLFDEVVVAVASSEDKKPMFTLEQRIQMINDATKGLASVRVVGFSNLTVDFAKEQNSKILIRGLRNANDFEYELQLAYLNNSLDESIESVYLMPKLDHTFISSSFVRNLIKFKGKISHLVPSEIEEFIGKIH